MRGTYFLGNGAFETRDMPEHPLAPHEVLIQVAACGVCGTDVHIYHGDKGSAEVIPPVVLGHELSGTVAAVGIFKLKSRAAKSAIMTVTNIPMMNPDIVTGISMMLLFVFVCVRLAGAASLSFATVLVAHITFNLPYVILSVMPKLRQMDRHLTEAALDLGCTPMQAFWKVELPSIMPGVVSGLIMAFTLSLDDFVISYFTTGSGFETLPIRIYSMTKKRVTPDMYALSTLIFIAVLALLILSNLAGSRGEKKSRAKAPVPMEVTK